MRATRASEPPLSKEDSAAPLERADAPVSAVTKAVVSNDITEAVFVYSVYLTLLSMAMAGFIAYEQWKWQSWMWDTVRDTSPNGANLAFWLWVNYISKPTEFFDTFFFIIKGNFRQVTALHVIHHTVMPTILHILLVKYPGGNSLCGPMINSLVHTIMYFYYACTAIGIDLAAFKMAITVTQLIQFVVLLVQALYCIHTNFIYWPEIVCYISMALMVLMMIMFGNFFAATYCGKKKAESEAPAAKKGPRTPRPFDSSRTVIPCIFVVAHIAYLAARYTPIVERYALDGTVEMDWAVTIIMSVTYAAAVYASLPSAAPAPGSAAVEDSKRK